MRGGENMGVASLVLGIVSVIFAFVPFCNTIAFIPAVIGFVLGIVEVVLKGKKQEPKGMGIAGIVLNACALVLIIIWIIGVGAAVSSIQ